MPETMQRANNAKSKIRARVEHVFAEQKDRMRLFIRTIGIARATTKNTLTVAKINPGQCTLPGLLQGVVASACTYKSACRICEPHRLQMRGATYYCGANIIATSVVAACLVVPLTKSAAADFRLCNNTQSRVGVAIGYKDADGWTTEGWWNLSSRTCENILKGNLV